MHAPEFAFEKVPENVERAVREAGITYPVALDNDFTTWRAFHNRYWPAKYLIDKEGKIRWTHFGEGEYDEAESQIRALLDEGGDLSNTPGQAMSHTAGQSPETYLGTRRALREETRLVAGEHDWTLSGVWNADEESITAIQDGAQLRYRFSGREMFLVMDGPEGAQVRVQVEGGDPPGGSDVQGETVTISGARLYRLVRLPEATGGTTVTLTFDAGVKANALTFG